MTPGSRAGCLITFEGGEGAGKSSQIRLLADALRTRAFDVVETREPGGSPGAEAVRHVLLSGAAEEFGVRMEAILFAAARSDHIEERIRSALADGSVILCDRFLDSTRVYQGATGNIEPTFLKRLEQVCLNGMMPDRTILLDIPAEAGLARAHGRHAGAEEGGTPDRFEKETVSIHESRRQAFLEIAANEPERFVVIDALQPIETIAEEVLAATISLIDMRGGHTVPSGEE